ncbi:hypothetical protein [Flavobacterium sp.]|uniref:hypothetical protein n=1 Tax=Flavobacterium sp. TaxID=239 RepID=UPI0040342255
MGKDVGSHKQGNLAWHYAHHFTGASGSKKQVQGCHVYKQHGSINAEVKML